MPVQQANGHGVLRLQPQWPHLGCNSASGFRISQVKASRKHAQTCYSQGPEDNYGIRKPSAAVQYHCQQRFKELKKSYDFVAESSGPLSAHSFSHETVRVFPASFFMSGHGNGPEEPRGPPRGRLRDSDGGRGRR